jgi:glycerol-3-phosphate acyltransferase PlsY
LATGGDLRDEGSGNPGATNLNRAAGLAWGTAALALDAGKGALAVLVAPLLAGDAASIPAALGAVLGHVFTPWLSGRGGKGVATAAGAFAVLAPAATAVAIAVFTIAAIVTRMVSLSSVLAAIALPIAVALLGPGARAAGNFERMRAGTEPRLGGRASGRGGAAR